MFARRRSQQSSASTPVIGSALAPAQDADDVVRAHLPPADWAVELVGQPLRPADAARQMAA